MYTLCSGHGLLKGHFLQTKTNVKFTFCISLLCSFACPSTFLSTLFFISVYKTIGVDPTRLTDNPTFGFSKVGQIVKLSNLHCICPNATEYCLFKGDGDAISCIVQMFHYTGRCWEPPWPIVKAAYDEVYVHFLLSIPRLRCVLRSINSPVSTGDGVEEGRNSLQPPAGLRWELSVESHQTGSFAFFCPAFANVTTCRSYKPPPKMIKVLGWKPH